MVEWIWYNIKNKQNELLRIFLYEVKIWHIAHHQRKAFHRLRDMSVECSVSTEGGTHILRRGVPIIYHLPNYIVVAIINI